MSGEKPLTLKSVADMCAQEFVIEYPNGSEKIWVRTRTQSEIEAATIEAAEARLRIVESYKPGQTLYESLVADLRLKPPYALVGVIAQAETGDIRARARRTLPTPMPFDGSRYRTDSDREKAEREHQDRLEQYEADVEAKCRELQNVREDQLLSEPKEGLVELALAPLLDLQLRIEINGLMEAYLIRDCVRCADDHSKPYFATLDEIPRGRGRIALLNCIGEVELVGVVDIKNSQGRSVLSTGPAESIPEVTEVPSTQTSPESDLPKPIRRGGRRRSATG